MLSGLACSLSVPCVLVHTAFPPLRFLSFPWNPARARVGCVDGQKGRIGKKAPDSLGLQLPPYHILTFWLLMRPLPPSDLTGLNLTRSGSVQDPARLDQSLQARVWACDMQITTAAKMDSLLRRPRSGKTASARQGREPEPDPTRQPSEMRRR